MVPKPSYLTKLLNLNLFRMYMINNEPIPSDYSYFSSSISVVYFIDIFRIFIVLGKVRLEEETESRTLYPPFMKISSKNKMKHEKDPQLIEERSPKSPGTGQNCNKVDKITPKIEDNEGRCEEMTNNFQHFRKNGFNVIIPTLQTLKFISNSS